MRHGARATGPDQILPDVAHSFGAPMVGTIPGCRSMSLEWVGLSTDQDVWSVNTAMPTLWLAYDTHSKQSVDHKVHGHCVCELARARASESAEQFSNGFRDRVCVNVNEEQFRN